MRRFILTIILLVSVYANAQNFCIRQLGLENQLSSNYVTSIAQDKGGFIWVATEEGLNMFYGSGFFNYYKKGVQGIINGNELNTLLDDPTDHVMWIGTQRNGLNAYNYQNKTVMSFRHNQKDPHSLCTDDITYLCAAKDSNIWVCTYWEGVDYLNKKDCSFNHFNTKTIKGMPSNQTWCALDDGEGHLYVGQVWHGLTVIDIQKKTAKNFIHKDSDPTSLVGKSVHSLCLDSNGRIWVGTDKGLDLYDPQSEKFSHFSDNRRLNCRIFDIKELADGQIWIATELSGIAVIDQKSGKPQLSFITEGNSNRQLSGNSIRHIFQDQFQNVWIGVNGSGLNFLTRQVPMFTQIALKSVLSVCQDQAGKTWIGTDGGGVALFVDGQQINYQATEFNGRAVQAAHCDKQGNLWFGCFNDNAYVKLASGDEFKKLFSNTTEDIRSFYEDNDGNMWICTSNGIYKADIRTQAIKEHYSLGQNLTRSMLIDRQGRRWVATFGEGIFICSPQMEIMKIIDIRNGLPSNTVNHLITDRHGHVWAGTAEGVVKFDQNDNLTIYGWNSNLDNIHIRAIAEDADGNIWVSTNKGISCMKNGEKTFCNYTASDNVPLANFNICSTTQGIDHAMFFGSTAGLCYFYPNQVLAERKAPNVNIIGVRIYTAKGDTLISLRKDEDLSLKYDENTFTVGLNIENFALYNEVEYSYKMDGLPGEWTMIGNNVLTFRNLKPGHYKLQVKCRIRNHQWNEQPAILDIYIAAPIWLSWWAKLFYMLCFIALCYYIYHSYQNYLHLRILKEQWTRLSSHIEQKQNDSKQEWEQKRHILQASLNELDQQFLSKINHLIEDRISSDKIEIGYLAEGANISQSTLYRKMKSLTGISTNEYVRKYKMHYAERLLLTGRYTISEVGYMIGMSSQSYFRKCFKEEFNVNPSDYQKRVKN